MCVSGIDPYHTKPNHIIEAESVLGIEAARSTIANEIKYIMDMHGMSVDFRHIGMLADTMTFKGIEFPNDYYKTRCYFGNNKIWYF